MAKKKWKAEVVTADEAQKELSSLRSSAFNRTSKFDPLKEQIEWLKDDQVLKVLEMRKNDVGNLRSYIQRNMNYESFDVKSSKIDEKGEKYRVFIFANNGN